MHKPLLVKCKHVLHCNYIDYINLVPYLYGKLISVCVLYI